MRSTVWKLVYTSIVLYIGILPIKAHITYSRNSNSLPWDPLVKVEFAYNGSYAVLSVLLSMVSLIGTDHLLSALLDRCVSKCFGRKVEQIESKLYIVLVMPYVLIYFIRFSFNMILMCSVLMHDIDVEQKMKLVGGLLLQLGLFFHAIELMLHWLVLWRFESQSPKPTQLSAEYVVYVEH